MLDLLLAYPYYPNETFYHLIFDWHIGTGYILAYLKKRGILADCFVHQDPASLQDIVQQILKYDPKIVGFSCYDVNYYFIKLLSRALKKIKKDITVIVGGPSATFSDELILNDEPSIDICVRGEGEQTAFELIKCLKTEKDLKSIKGITYRRGGSVVRTEDRPLLEEPDKNCELDIYPSPYISGVFPPELNRGILTSRGCIYRCIYCNFASMSRWTIRYHSVKRVVDELKYIAAANPNSTVSIHDDNFSLNKNRAKEICQRIIEERLPLQFSCLGRADHIDEELLRLMKKANFKWVAIGLESSVPKNLRTINKVADDRRYGRDLSPERKYISKIKTLSDRMRRLGLNLEISIITGLPNQSQNEAQQTVDFVDKLRPFQCFHDFLTIYPGTPLFWLRKKFGLDIIPPKTVLPFKTKFSFDVNKIRLSRYALANYTLVENLIGISKKILTRIVCHQEGLDILEVFFRNGWLRLSEFVTKTGLKNRLTLSPVFILRCESDKHAKKELYRLIENGIPLINLLILRKLKNKDPGLIGNFLHIYELVFLTEIIERRRLPFQKVALFAFIPLSKLNREILAKIRKLKNGKYDRKIIILSLNGQEDKARFMDLASDNIPLRKVMEDAAEEFHMLNACQWINRLCPAMAEDSLYVSKNGRVSFCNKNISLRAQNEKPGLIKIFSKSEKQTLLQETERRRNCQSCEVDKSCSKCLYTYPYTEKEFCKLRKKTDTARFVRLLTVYDTLKGLARYKSLTKYHA